MNVLHISFNLEILDMENDNQTTSYAMCNVCKQTMAPGNGCDILYLKIDGHNCNRIRVGDNDDIIPVKTTCHDCNAGKDQYHHLGCAQERCPSCREQFFLCNCVPTVFYAC